MGAKSELKTALMTIMKKNKLEKTKKQKTQHKAELKSLQSQATVLRCELHLNLMCCYSKATSNGRILLIQIIQSFCNKKKIKLNKKIPTSY